MKYAILDLFKLIEVCEIYGYTITCDADMQRAWLEKVE